jgi:leucyl aminopeptidase
MNPIKAAARALDAMMPATARGDAIPVWLMAKPDKEATLARLPAEARAWIAATAWEPAAERHLLLPDAGGRLAGVVLGLGDPDKDGAAPLALGALPGVLPEGDYRLAEPPADAERAELMVLGWLLGAYKFERYRTGKPAKPRRLQLPEHVERERIALMAESITLGRDLINTPANDLGPEELEAAARAVAEANDADVSSVVGEELLARNFPMIHAVGRASVRAPRLVDIAWGKKKAPKVTLVGKGICFDTGGLNIKPGDSMALMKKDMGGAATALALGAMIMRAKLPVRLRVLLAIAENSISGNAFRPGDVLQSRAGITVEIGNTDAEGRLVLADALALACEDKPDLVASFATLTGAARVALGPDLPPLYATDTRLAADIVEAGMRVDDPVWHMPFWAPYDKLLASKIADVNHISSGSFAGSVTAALFLKRFVKDAGSYSHFDIYGWVPKAKPGRPEGGEPQAARAMFELLSQRYGAR